MNLRLQPTADKYYTIGVVDDPRGKFSSAPRRHRQRHAADDTEERVRQQAESLNALIARKFSGLTVKGGVIESTGGLGAGLRTSQEPAQRRGGRLRLHPARQARAHLKLYGNYDIVKNLFVTGGVDDVLATERNLRTLFLGFGIKFADEDIKTVIGAVPIKP